MATGTDFDITAFVLPTDSRSKQQASPISQRLSYNIHVNSGLVGLLPKNPNSYDTLQGLLYVPPLPDESACANGTLRLIPDNATSIMDIPSADYPLMAIFPWASISCTQAFLAMARNNVARGAVVFQPNSGPNIPNANDPVWSLQDNGQWKVDNQYPIYAVSAQMGSQILTAMAQYSGDNLTSAPFGQSLSQLYDPTSVARLLLKVDVIGSSVPSLWTFLIIVLAVLLGLVILASIVMHLLQRHQRHALQRRLARGEVDLESLGIKKMNVPQEQIDKMPSFLYRERKEKDDALPSSTAAVSPTKAKSQAPNRDTSFSQNTCAICLDDYVDNETMIRELPCKHIFHPDCIDPFLRDNSSLCPLCKKSALPAGYCPVRVTNIMVRRERLVRRMRERRRRSIAALTGTPIELTRKEKIVFFVKKLLRVGDGLPAAAAAAPDANRPRSWTQRHGRDLEMASTAATDEANATTTQVAGAQRRPTAMPAEIASQSTAVRRAWRRERLARQQEQNYTQQEEAARRSDEGRSAWRRGLDRIFPGTG